MARSITDIQTDLTAAYAARRKALEAESYSQNSGQGSLSVSRSLSSINKTIAILKDELEEAQEEAGMNTGGIFNPVFVRGNL